jgi:hypothetical protein
MSYIYKNKRLLHVLLGLLIASSAYLYLEYRYEKKVLQAFIQSVYSNSKLNFNDDKAVILAAMEKTHLQMRQKEITSMGLELNGFEQFATSPLLQFALTKDGACGGNSLVLAQILTGMGFKVRPGQMQVNGVYGGHIILETKLNNRWIVLDPMFNLSFTNKSGELATFEEVKNDWAFYKAQVPANYKMEYQYQGMRYTNWAKIPFLGSIVKGTISLFAGKSYAETFSARSLILNPKKILFFLSIYILGFSIISIFNKKYLKIRVPKINIKPALQKKPVTFP